MKQGYINLDTNNKMYYEINGNLQGQPLLLVHGGPGSGINETPRLYIDLSKYMLIQYDQRGCGKSTPTPDLAANNTINLIDDIDKLLDYLKIEKVMVAGNSWGSTLALLYAQKNPQRVISLDLAGIFLANQKSLDWFMTKGGSSRILPDLYKKLESELPADCPREYQAIASFYSQMIKQDDKQQLALDCFMTYHDRLAVIDEMPAETRTLEARIANMLVATEYIKNRFYLTDNQILKNMNKLKNIPIQITQGRFDLLCLVDDVYDLQKAFDGQINIQIIEDSGHKMSEKMKQEYYANI